MIGMSFFARLTNISLLTLSILASPHWGISEMPSPAKTSGPNAFLQLLMDKNGLDFSSGIPWHIKLSYKQFDDGNEIRSGDFEEYYVDPKKYKVSFTGTFTQTDVATDSGLFRSGNPEWMGPAEFQVQNEVLHPVHPSDKWSKPTKPDFIEWPLESQKLPCVIARRTDVIIADLGSQKFCFDRGSSRLRYTSGKGRDQTLYNNLMLFQGRTVAKDITVLKGGNSSIKIHVDILEPFTPTDDIFTPPTGSALIMGRVNISSFISDTYVVKEGEQPHGTGGVNVHFAVGEDGHVIEADALDGPQELQKAALESMRKYVFRPFLIRGRSVEFESTMVIHFLEIPEGHIYRSLESSH